MMKPWRQRKARTERLLKQRAERRRERYRRDVDKMMREQVEKAFFRKVFAMSQPDTPITLARKAMSEYAETLQ